MAPTVVIDLTSSPEPDDTPARIAALSHFQPRKQKISGGYGGIPSIPVNGLPFFYEGHGQRHDNDDDVFLPGLQGVGGPQDGPRTGVDNVPIGNIAPTAFEESLHNIPKRSSSVATNTQAAAPRPQPHGFNINNSKPLEESAFGRIGEGLHSSFAQGQPRDAPADTLYSLAMQQNAVNIQSSRTAETPGGAPTEFATQQQTSKRNEICPNCSKRFHREDKMQRHRQRCEARSTGTASTNVVTLAPQGPLPLAGVPNELAYAGPMKASPAIIPLEKEQFNPLKRSISPTSDKHQMGRNGSSKRTRADPSTLEPQQYKQPRPEVQLVNVTDDALKDFVLSDSSNIQPLEPTRPQTYNPGSTHIGVPGTLNDLSHGPSRSGLPYSAEEDALLVKLKEVDKLPFSDIVNRFSGRGEGSLKVHYYTLCKKRSGPTRQKLIRPTSPGVRSQAKTKRVRKSKTADGMVPRASVKQARREEQDAAEAQRERKRRKPPGEQRFQEVEVGVAISEVSVSDAGETLPSNQDSAYPSSTSRILRLRELGTCGRRAWNGHLQAIPDELKDHVFSDYDLQRDYQGTSGDVISLAWNDNGRFVASSIAIADQQSMQYNMHRNLLVGDTNRGEVKELLEHHIPRPVVENTANINANHAMRESQDPRLFLSVVAAKFCPQDSTRLFTAGMDRTLRHYTVEADEVTHRYAVEHTAPVSLLAVGGGHGLVATGCHQPTRNVNIFECDVQGHEVKWQLSPRQATVPVYPSALKWGVAHQHRNFILAGFSGEEDVASSATGETCLWEVSTGQRIHLGGAARNVFDVAWNPIPSSSSIAFAVAGNANGHAVDKGMRSVVQCFAAGPNGGRGVLDWQCPALDINDLVFCPYDDNLIAAGATNGRVYIWDKRSADRSQRPLHVLKHGESLNVLDHERDAEIADTGVQFLAWGPTKSRLYSGSSDGIVKVWNPYRSSHSAHVDDISGPARDRSAVMSGAFSPDFQELLIGTENGRINLFQSGSDPVTRKSRQFKLIPGPEPEKEQQEPFVAAHALVETGQIEFKPCGAMPFRQAVQGPNYSGPFLKPSKAQRREAEERLELAVLAQARAGDGYHEAEFTKAAKAVEVAEEVVADLRRRRDLARVVLPKAKASQRELAELEKSRMELEALVGDVERCKLGCAVLPQRDGDNEDEEVEDSGLSELRIPGLLRYGVGEAGSMDQDASLPECSACYPKQRDFGKRRVHNFSTACVLKRARLTSACAGCGKVTRPASGDGKEALCERCAFACFRCGISAEVSEDSGFVHCRSCKLEWELGVLGYDLVQAPSAPKAVWDMMEVDDADEPIHEVGDEDRDFYARRWGT